MNGVIIYIVIWVSYVMSIMAPTDCFIAVSDHNEELAKIEKIRYIQQGQELTIHPVFKRGNTYFSTAKRIIYNNEIIDCKPLEKKMKWELFEVKASNKTYDNMIIPENEDMSTYIEPIEYNVSSLNKLNKIRAKSPGTTYIAINIEGFINVQNKAFVTRELLHHSYSDKIVQLVIRRDDTYLGYLSELMNTPFIYTPKIVGGLHQTDQRVGSDCAEFAIYGAKRMGISIPYCGPSGLPNYTDKLTDWLYTVNKDGYEIYVDQDNRPVVVGEEGIKPGDLLHFMEQVSVFYEDKGMKGILDQEDLLFHADNSFPDIVPIKETGFTEHPLKIYRFPMKEK